MDIPGFLKRDGDSLVFTEKGEFVFYVPEMYFERSYAIIYGEYVNLIGILNYAIFDEKGKHSGLKTFNFPTVFLSKPSEIEKVKNIKLTNTSIEQDYRLLKFKKGDVIVVSVKVPQMVDNAEEFYKIFTSGKLPNTIKYDELQNYFTENIELNGAKYGLNMQIFGVIIGEMCRSSKDKKILFRHTDMKDMTDYQTLNITEIPKFVSPFTSITSENWDESVVNAIINKNAKYSPLESLFMD